MHWLFLRGQQVKQGMLPIHAITIITVTICFFCDLSTVQQ